MAERVTYQARYESGVLIFSIAGELDIYTLPKVKEAIRLILDSGVKGLILDVTSLNHLDSSAIGFLLQIDKDIRANRGLFILACPSMTALEVMKTTRVDRMLNIHSSIPTAVQAIHEKFPSTEAHPPGKE